ncbi:MAG: hypothetical protein K2Y37_05705 [Pirellulales bacterium]|nr:hypothetical protein [Pirellulales bacterium]
MYARILGRMLIAMAASAWVANGLEAAEPAAPASDEAKRSPEKPAELSREELEKQFAEMLSGAQLVGVFTTTGQESEKAPLPDKYTIDRVKKLKNDFWLFEARIQYNNNDVKVPLPLEVKWAGDTPVITLTKVLVPGLGTFTARVLFYNNEYAGTWSAGDHGGHMYGKVVKLPADEKPSAGDATGSSDADKN